MYFVNGKQMILTVDSFMVMEDGAGVAQVRVLPATGAEKFAQYVFEKLDDFVKEETDGRVKVRQVEFSEHGKNSAIFTREQTNI